MSRGLLYVSFGEACDKLAVHTIAYSRQFTDLPIHVLTNVQNRCKRWKNLSGITFNVFKVKTELNREYKTRMNMYTPFDETLYLDCDSVVQKKGIEQAFEFEEDVALNLFLYWEKGDKIIRLYRNAMQLSNVYLPLCVYNGACICFKRRDTKINEFFRLWHHTWEITGKGREMPALACALKSSGVSIKKLPKNFFAPDYYKPESTVQHNYTPNDSISFWDRYNIPHTQLLKNFDGDKTDWNWVDE